MAINPKITAADMAEFLDLTVQAVHKRIKTQGLKEKKTQNRVYFNHSTSRKICNISQLSAPKKLAFAVVKGGVGKTTLLEAFAVRSSLLGYKVLCVDMDQQGNLTAGLGMSESAKTVPVLIDLVEDTGKSHLNPHSSVLNVSDGLDLIPSRLDNVTLDGYLMLNRINLTTMLDSILGDVFKDYDLVLFDCPPTLGSTVTAAILASDTILCPLNPDPYSYDGIEIMNKEFSTIEQQFRRNVNWRIILNKFESRTILSSNYIKNILQHETFRSKLLDSVIRTAQEFSNSKSKGKTIYDSFKKTNCKEDVNALVTEVLISEQILSDLTQTKERSSTEASAI